MNFWSFDMKKENSLKINPAEKKKLSTGELLPKATAVFAAAFGFSAMLSASFGFEKMSLFFGTIVGLLAAACVFLYQKKFGKHIPLAVSGISLLAVLVFSELENGVLVLANEVCDFLVSATGKIYLPFEIFGSGKAEIALLLILTAMCVFLSTAVMEKSVVPALPVISVGLFGLAVGFLSTDFYFLVFAAGTAAVFICVFAPENGEKFSAKAEFSKLFVPAVCILACAAITMLIPANVGESIKEFAEGNVHSLVFDSKTNAMPEGDFENLGTYNKNDAPALEITMEKPQKLYLKGFIGEVYNGMGWEELENEILAEYAGDFYILHQEGFFGQKAVSSALEATGETESTVLSIRNISACSKRAYLPYAFSSAPLDEDMIGDAVAESFGETYSLSYIPGGLSEWYKAQVELSEKQGADAATDEHLENEYIYREFVKANYLSVPEDAYNAIDKIFENEGASTATEIISAILLYLENGVTYDEKVATKTGGEDFATFFLEKTARGYSVHYATAATLMLRYFGIPARYAEGYFLSAEEAAELEDGETIILTENHAHAWAEYYLEGVGWVPFEVTPGYMDDELEKAAFSTSGESSKRYEQSELPETNVEQDRPKDDITEAKIDHTVLIAAAVTTVILLLFAALVYVITMRKRLKNALIAIDNADNKAAVAMRFGYAEKLLENADIDAKRFGYDEAFEINREALFSEHEISDEQRKTVDNYANNILAECNNNWSFWQKIKNRFVKFIY